MGDPGGRALEETRRLRALRDELEAWEGGPRRDPLMAHHHGELGAYLDGLRELAGARDSRADGVLLAALALGPRGRLPGAGDLGPLLEAASGTRAGVVDLAIAWGCGWRRSVATGHGWHGRWVAALLALASLVRGSINRTTDWLEGQVPGVREALYGLGTREREERSNSYAQQLALELSHGACRCSHGARGDDAGAPCGRPDHDLASWRPEEEVSLPAFAAAAVRGLALKRPSAGAFSVGMLADLLRDDRLVRVDLVEFHVCHLCNADQVRRAREGGSLDLGQVVEGLYELNRCRDCDAPADPWRTYQVARKNWLIVPADWGGRYVPVRRYRCASCGNLFAAGLERCPLCQHPSGQRHTLVWVRRAGIDVRRSIPRAEAFGL
jgi:hypothetical protein